MASRRSAFCHLKRPAQLSATPPGRDACQRTILPSYGRDGGADFDPLTAALADVGCRALRPQPRGIAKSTGP
jgi:hypothetical protein